MACVFRLLNIHGLCHSRKEFVSFLLIAVCVWVYLLMILLRNDYVIVKTILVPKLYASRFELLATKLAPSPVVLTPPSTLLKQVKIFENPHVDILWSSLKSRVFIMSVFSIEINFYDQFLR